MIRRKVSVSSGCWLIDTNSHSVAARTLGWSPEFGQEVKLGLLLVLHPYSFKHVRREDTAAPASHAMTGQVVLIEPGADHGFLLTNTGTQLYFHRDSVTDTRFADLRVGDIVHYVEEDADAGPTASKIRAAKSAR